MHFPRQMFEKITQKTSRTFTCAVNDRNYERFTSDYSFPQVNFCWFFVVIIAYTSKTLFVLHNNLIFIKNTEKKTNEKRQFCVTQRQKNQILNMILNIECCTYSCGH